MTNAILLAILLAIVAANIVFGPRGYRLLAEAHGVARKQVFRRMLAMHLVLFTLLPVIALLVLGRIDAITAMPTELWPASALLRGGDPAAYADPLIVSIYMGIVLVAVPLGAFLTWRRMRKGKGAPAHLANIAALLPRDREEVLLGAAISVAAGVGEELFFRLLLPMLLAAFVGGIPAVALAIVLFGAAHAYQGVKGIAVTVLVGMPLMVMYLGSGSLVIAMLFHATIDLMTLAIRPAIRGAWRKEAG